MKFLLHLPVAILLSFAWAIQVLAAEPSSEPLPAAEPSSEPLPAASTDSHSIAPVTVEQNPELVSPDARSQKLDNQAEQINQNLEHPNNERQQLREILNLPDGMIIRGSSRGGIGIGTEY